MSNALLSRLDPGAWAALAPQFERVALGQRTELLRADEPFQYIWFPEGGVYSQVVGTADGSAVEVFMTGNEGVVGLPAVYGMKHSVSRSVAQFDATALRIPSDTFAQFVTPDHPLSRAIDRYAGAALLIISQLSACNRLHSSEQRICRWLLCVRDRIHRNDFQITHEFLSLMVGTRRASVTETAHSLQQRGLIEYERRFIAIRDAQALRAAACECYEVISRVYSTLLEWNPRG